MAINKLQGRSFGYVGVDLRIPPFTHGQLYVALPNGTEHHTPRGVAPVLDRISYSHCAPTLTAPRLGEVAENLVIKYDSHFHALIRLISDINDQTDRSNLFTRERNNLPRKISI
jgi:hypothetical protein